MAKKHFSAKTQKGLAKKIERDLNITTLQFDLRALRSRVYYLSEALDCGNSFTYQGFGKPTCNGGFPCKACLAKYADHLEKQTMGIEELKQRAMTAGAGVVQTILGKPVKQIHIDFHKDK